LPDQVVPAERVFVSSHGTEERTATPGPPARRRRSSGEVGDDLVLVDRGDGDDGVVARRVGHAVVPSLPAEAMESTPELYAFAKAVFSVLLLVPPPRLMLTTFAPALRHALRAPRGSTCRSRRSPRR